jgi:hypothetical protein
MQTSSENIKDYQLHWVSIISNEMYLVTNITATIAAAMMAEDDNCIESCHDWTCGGQVAKSFTATAAARVV